MPPSSVASHRTLFARRNTREGQGRPVERIRHFGDTQTSKNVITWDLTACTCLISSLKPHTVHCAHGKGGPKGKGRGRSVVLDRPAARVDFTLQLSQQQDITSRASAIHQSAPDGQLWRCAVTALGITLHRVRDTHGTWRRAPAWGSSPYPTISNAAKSQQGRPNANAVFASNMLWLFLSADRSGDGIMAAHGDTSIRACRRRARSPLRAYSPSPSSTWGYIWGGAQRLGRVASQDLSPPGPVARMGRTSSMKHALPQRLLSF